MNNVLSITTIITLITLLGVMIAVNFIIIPIYADEPSEFTYCATDKGKDEVSIKVCSMDKEKCEQIAEANDISARCHKIP